MQIMFFLYQNICCEHPKQMLKLTEKKISNTFSLKNLSGSIHEYDQKQANVSYNEIESGALNSNSY